MQEMQIQPLHWEDPLEKEMAILSSILLWRIPWMEEPGGLQSTESQRVGYNWVTSLWFSHIEESKPINRHLFYLKQKPVSLL